jgi:hypothetical protein
VFFRNHGPDDGARGEFFSSLLGHAASPDASSGHSLGSIEEIRNINRAMAVNGNKANTIYLNRSRFILRSRDRVK